eukprot:2840314-Prymnesium_polylepis.1
MAHADPTATLRRWRQEIKSIGGTAPRPLAVPPPADPGGRLASSSSLRPSFPSSCHLWGGASDTDDVLKAMVASTLATCDGWWASRHASLIGGGYKRAVFAPFESSPSASGFST